MMWPTTMPGGCHCPTAVLTPRKCRNLGIHPMTAAERRLANRLLWIESLPEATQKEKERYVIRGRDGMWKKASPEAIRVGARVPDTKKIIHAYSLWEGKAFQFTSAEPDRTTELPWPN